MSSTKPSQDDHAGEDAGHVEDALGLVNQIAEACRRAEIFAHHRADQAKPTEVCSEENTQDRADGQ
jgi:hypothetical protein